MRENYLDSKHTEVKTAIAALLKTVAFPHLITLALDGWTDINNTSVWVIIALLPLIGPVVLATINASAESHNGEWIAGKHSAQNTAPFTTTHCTYHLVLAAAQIKQVMEKFGPKNFGAIVSDNGGGCEKGRLLVKEAYPHIIVQR